MKEESLQKLIDQCLEFFRQNDYTLGRIDRYECHWKHGIVKYMAEKGLETYNSSIGEEFIAMCNHDGIVSPGDRDVIRSVMVLDSMLNEGSVPLRCDKTIDRHLGGSPLGDEMEKFVLHMENMRRSKQTIQNYRQILYNFLNYLTLRGRNEIDDILEDDIVGFTSSVSKNLVNTVSALRVMFQYWVSENLTDKDWCEFFESFKMQRRERIPSFYEPEEVMRIERSVSRSSAVGKRNYAMLLLASRLGLRASDIAGLEFGNIDWKSNMITLTMKKTGKPIELPLLAEVGNAIIDYLRNARPHSKSDRVFLSCRAPYREVERSIVCGAIGRLIMDAGVDVSLRHHGPHSMRHSLASSMLKGDTTIPVISEALGHKSSDTTMVYLGIDIKSMLEVALPVPPVADGFYMQRGGAFYE